jgi:hypothetical protein
MPVPARSARFLATFRVVDKKWRFPAPFGAFLEGYLIYIHNHKRVMADD